MKRTNKYLFGLPSKSSTTATELQIKKNNQPEPVVNMLHEVLIRQVGNTRLCPHCKKSFIPDDRTAAEAWFVFQILFGNNEVSNKQERRRTMLNLNEFARQITLKEGRKKQISIAQVKEVMRILLTELAKMEPVEAIKVIMRYRKEK